VLPYEQVAVSLRVMHVAQSGDREHQLVPAQSAIYLHGRSPVHRTFLARQFKHANAILGRFARGASSSRLNDGSAIAPIDSVRSYIAWWQGADTVVNPSTRGGTKLYRFKTSAAQLRFGLWLEMLSSWQASFAACRGSRIVHFSRIQIISRRRDSDFVQ
jgi:hypothetical protein